jgi:hypothetical protein
LEKISYPCSIHSAFHSPVLEQHVGHASCGAILAQTSNTQAVTREAAVSVLRHDIGATICYIDTVVTVITVVAIDGDVGTANADTVGVGGERDGLVAGAVDWCCVMEMVGDLDVGPRNAHTPSDRFVNLDVGDLTVCHVERRKSRAVGL